MLSTLFSDVNCPECRERLEECPRNKFGFPIADVVFDVGNNANHQLGHAMYFDNDGRVAICVARRLSPEDAQSQLNASRRYGNLKD